MSRESRSDIHQSADQARMENDLSRAGDEYLRLGHLGIVQCDLHHQEILSSINIFKYATILFRADGSESRCENTAQQAELLCEDIIANRIDGDSVEQKAWEGLANEHLGDLKLLSNRDPEDHHKIAQELYQDVEAAGPPHPIIAWATEEPFYQSTQFVLRLSDAANRSIDEDLIRDLFGRSLTRRISYRRSTFEDTVRTLTNTGRLQWDPDDIWKHDD